MAPVFLSRPTISPPRPTTTTAAPVSSAATTSLRAIRPQRAVPVAGSSPKAYRCATSTTVSSAKCMSGVTRHRSRVRSSAE
jgi:hypothetical protein